MTKDEFEQRYAERSGVTMEDKNIKWCIDDCSNEPKFTAAKIELAAMQARIDTLELSEAKMNMGKYPKIITPEIVKSHSHISTDEIKRDIADTKREIDDLIKGAEGNRLIAEANIGTPEGKMAAFRQSAKEQGAVQRIEFIEFLDRLLEARKSATGAKS